MRRADPVGRNFDAVDCFDRIRLDVSEAKYTLPIDEVDDVFSLVATLVGDLVDKLADAAQPV